MREHLAPDAVGAVYQDAVKVSRFRRTTQSNDGYSAHDAELMARTHPGGSRPASAASALCLAAWVPVGVAGRRFEVAPFLGGADFLALFRKKAL